MGMRPLVMLPEILLFLGGLTVLLGGSFLPRTRQWVARLVAAGVLVAAAVAAAVQLAGGTDLAFHGTFTADTGTGVARVVVAVVVLLLLGVATDELAGSPRESETYALLLFASTGAVLLAGASDLLVLAVAFLLASIPLYGLIGIGLVRGPGPPAAEAVMKTYLLGALFGILLMLGVTVLYGLGGGTSYDGLGDRLAQAPPAALALGGGLVLLGLMFKAGGVPAHFWVPDAAQATGGTVAAFVTTVPKVGAVIAAYRLVLALPDSLAWGLLIAVLAATGMTLGNLAAYAQTDPRRLLGWSTVAQVGFLLVPVAVAGRTDLAMPSLLVYLAGYAVTNVAAFAVVAALPERRHLDSYRGLGFSRPWLGAALAVALLGLVGTPPTAVFVGKLTTATAAWEGGSAWLAVVVLVNTLVSLYYYLRWLAPAYRHGEPVARTAPGAFVPRPAAAAVAVVAAVATLLLGLGAGLLWAVADGPPIS